MTTSKSKAMDQRYAGCGAVGWVMLPDGCGCAVGLLQAVTHEDHRGERLEEMPWHTSLD